MRQPATAMDGHQFDYDYIGHFGSTAKVCSQHNSPDSNVFGFKVPTLNSEFKISGDITKPGSFYIRSVHLCVNGKANPVLKHPGFVMNPEQFPVV